MIDAVKNEVDLDLSYLREMSGNSADFIIEMLDVLSTQIPIYLDDLAKAVDAKDWKATSGYAHKLKPTFCYVGREDLRDYIQVIEDNAKGLINLDNIPEAITVIREELKQILVQVQKAKADLEQ